MQKKTFFKSSSSVFFGVYNSSQNLDTEISFLNHFILKRGIKDVVAKIELRCSNGKLKKTFDFWEEKKFTIAVYGAGAHTIELASIFNIRKYVKFYIDGDPRKNGSDFLGRQIIAPSEIKENNVDAVLISSGRFQTEMMSLISHYDIKIETCYD